MSFPYSNFNNISNLTLVLEQNNKLFTRDLQSEYAHQFFSGYIPLLPNSFVRLHSRKNGAVEGTIHLGNDLGSLHLESASNYHHSEALAEDSVILYHDADLIPKSERKNRKMKKRQTNGPATMDAVEFLHRIRVALEKYIRLRSTSSNGLITSNRLPVNNRPDTSIAPSEPTTSTTSGTSASSSLNDNLITNPVNMTSISKRQSQGSSNFYDSNYSGSSQPSSSNNMDSNQDRPSGDSSQTSSNAPPGYYYDQPSHSYMPYSTSSQPQDYNNQDSSTNHNTQVQNTQNICVMALIADNSYYRVHGEDSESIMMGHIASISGYYEQQLGIALAVSFTYIARGGDDYGFNLIPNDADNVVEYINAAAAKIPGINSEAMCIIATFSSSDLSDNAVGVSYVGTVCQPGGQTIIIQDRAGTMPKSEMSAVGMHEIGHSLGAGHDDPNGECDPTPNSDHYVMYPTVTKCDSMFTLSTCSITSIQSNLQKPEHQCMYTSSRGRSGYRSKAVGSDEIMIRD